MGKNPKLWPCLLTVVVLQACDTPKVDTSMMAEQMKDRAIKRVTTGQVLEHLERKGNQATKRLDAVWESTLEEIIARDGISKATLVCKPANFPVADSLRDALGASISRFSRLRPLSEIKNPIEKQVYDAYLYNLENNISSLPNLQDLRNDSVLFTSPIVLQKPLCFSCHGIKEKEVSASQYSRLLSIRPDSSLTGHKKGATLGYWNIIFSKRAAIRNFDHKKFKKERG